MQSFIKSTGPVYAIIRYASNNHWVSTRYADIPLTTVRSQLLVEGFVVQLDRDGFELVNPLTNESVIINKRQ